MKIKTILPALSACLFINCVTEIVHASPIVTPKVAKAFAVFTASFNSQGDLVRGGVNGTVFFVSKTRAITAYHVLQARTFHPLPGFEHVRVWLVHENEKPIEIKASDIEPHPEHDTTIVHLSRKNAAPSKFVFKVASVTRVTDKVEAEGFRANTVGPTLRRNGTQVEIVAVPKLERMHLEGKVVREANIVIQAVDLDLHGAPCVQLSYPSIVGFSGGPVVSNGRVIAMNSFAEPSTFKQTWAQLLNPPPKGLLPRP